MFRMLVTLIFTTIVKIFSVCQVLQETVFRINLSYFVRRSNWRKYFRCSLFLQYLHITACKTFTMSFFTQFADRDIFLGEFSIFCFNFVIVKENKQHVPGDRWLSSQATTLADPSSSARLFG